MKKNVKRCLIFLALTITFAITLCASVISVNYLKFTKIPLNAQALTSPSLSIILFDNENREIQEDNQFNGSFCRLEDLSPHTKNAFISIEDKEFYKHKGINKKRIIKAMLNNLKSFKLKEGASTISQQLIKNTHLSGEKTFTRKLKEVALTKKLEKQFSKDEILESYLNIIFFGNNCYGLESASNYYFSKSAKDLNLQESCTLAGMIKSPAKYSPITNYDNCLNRRNLVLKEMAKDGHISLDEKLLAQSKPIDLNISKREASEKLNSYTQAAIDEASKILDMPAKQLALSGYKIHTYCNQEKQEALKNSLKKNHIEDVSNCAIAINSKQHAVEAYYGNSNLKLLDIKRQPASCIKPLLVFAPAFNEGIISPDTQILDEKIKIGEYSPANVNNKFSGYVSITDAVKNSINIPAIKVLSYIGVDCAKQYCEKLGITFDSNDNSYALALGGMTYGTTLKDLTNAYTVFNNRGNYDKCVFVKYITDSNNRLVYVHKPQEISVFRDDATYLMTNILQETAKNGTARKLSTFSACEVSSKTGTVGNKNGNTDAYNITYTPDEVVGVWYGNLDNSPSPLAGGNQPTQAVLDYLSNITFENKNFEIPSSVTTAKIDSLELEKNHRLVLASPYAPSRYTQESLFSRFNMPTEVSLNFLEKPKINATATAQNNQIVLVLKAEKHIGYQIYKDEVPYQNIKDKQDTLTVRLPFNEKECRLKIVANYSIENEETLESEKTFTLVNNQKTQIKSNNQKWYI
ncbi:MAG: penicillin-binding protein [Clostridia bacterium]|nr:penicillin-binding protein [Clostridia bacterium]